MRTDKLGWWISGAVIVVLLAGGGIAFAVTRHSTPKAAAPTASASASTPATGASPSPTVAPSPGADITGPLDLLILGVDTRVTIPGWEPHSDALMLLHVEPGLKTAYLYSLPRDLLVKMPAFAKAKFGGGTYKITEAMSRGSHVGGAKTTISVPQGYELLTKTITAYTGIKTFQAGAILNFGGLAELVDQLGGIDMTVDETVKSHHHKPDGTARSLVNGEYVGPQKVYNPGKQHFAGWEAIDYARQRYGLPNGDYDRQRHQRQMIKAILTKAAAQGIDGNLTKVQGVITALGNTLVDVGGRKPLEIAYALRNLTPAGITMVGLPGGGVTINGQYRGEQLTAEGKGFLKAVAQDKIAGYLEAHPKLITK